MRIEGGAATAGWGDQSQDLDTTKVQAGETGLAQVAARLGVSAEALQTANPQIANANGLTPGIELRIPSSNGSSAAVANTAEEDPAGGSALAASKRMESNVDSILAKSALAASLDASSAPDAAAAPGGGIPPKVPVAHPHEAHTPEVKPDKMQNLTQSPQFQALSSAEQTSVLQALASNPPLTQEKVNQTVNLLGALPSLSAGDRQIALDGFSAAHANPAYAANMKKLIDDPKFTSLSAADKTSVLSQARNYPDATTVGNIDRLVHKDWFRNEGSDDKQRSLKTIARFSHNPDGNRRIINNTLDKFLSPASDFKLEWKSLDPGTYGEALGKTLTLNSDMIKKGDEKMEETPDTNRLSLNTVAHEVNHLLNHDVPANTFQYVNGEYRAWYVGFQTQHGRPPTNEEAVNQRLRDLVDDSFYGPYTAAAAADPTEGPKLFHLLKSVTGMNVDATNWKQVIHNYNPDDKPTLSTSPAAAPVGNNDNH